jgi:hypothetical protein
LSEELIAYTGVFASGIDRRSYRTVARGFNVDYLPQKGICRLPVLVLRNILGYLDQPKEDTFFRMTCVRFRNYCPLDGHLNFDRALSFCQRRLCKVPKHQFLHWRAFDKTVALYRRYQCRIRFIKAIKHGVKDCDLLRLRGHPLEVVKVSGDYVTDIGIKILAEFSIKILRFDGLQDPDKNLKHLKKMPLRELSFSAPDITDRGLRHIENMPLEKLKIRCYTWSALITGWGLKYLWKMPLRDLEISDSCLSGRALHFLKVLPLERLALNTPLPVLTFEDLLALKRDMPTLKRVELNGSGM